MKDDSHLLPLVGSAKDGDRHAAEKLVRALEDDVYRLALRMIGPADAQDATQEILLKVLTHLGTFRGESAFGTWVYRIAANHLLSMRRGQQEIFSFEMMEAMNAQGLAAGDVPLPPNVDEEILAEEVRLGCTQAAVLSLDREHRMAFILGEILELPGDVAAEVLEIEPAAFRKRLSRARDRVHDFMRGSCGLTDPERACRCEKQAGPTVAAGVIDPKRLVYATHARAGSRPDFREALRQVKDLRERATIVLRSHPEYVAPEALTRKLRELLASGRFGALQN